MLTVIEVLLTVLACYRLHKSGKAWALALIPIILAAILGYVLGIAGVDNFWIITLIDLACIAALVWIAVAYRPVKKLENTIIESAQ